MSPLAEGRQVDASTDHPERSLRLDPALYPAAAIEGAQVAFAEHCTYARHANHMLIIRTKQAAPSAIIDEFLNDVLRRAVQFHLGATFPTLAIANLGRPSVQPGP